MLAAMRGLDHAWRGTHDRKRRERESDRMGSRERGDDLHQLLEAATQEQESDEKGDVIVSGEDVLDSKPQESSGGRPKADVTLDLEPGRGGLQHALRNLPIRKGTLGE